MRDFRLKALLYHILPHLNKFLHFALYFSLNLINKKPKNAFIFCAVKLKEGIIKDRKAFEYCEKLLRQLGSISLFINYCKLLLLLLVLIIIHAFKLFSTTEPKIRPNTPNSKGPHFHPALLFFSLPIRIFTSKTGSLYSFFSVSSFNRILFLFLSYLNTILLVTVFSSCLIKYSMIALSGMLRGKAFRI